MDKQEIAGVLEQTSILMELHGENPFRIRSYQNAAQAIESLEEDLELLVKEERLTEIPGIGKHLADHILELFKTGELAYFNELKKSTPPGLVEMLEIAGLGPKKIKKIHEELKIDTVESLKKACQEGKISALSGFGKKSEEGILEGIKHQQEYSKRHLWWNANEVARGILGEMIKLSYVSKAEIAGSIRRNLETIGDLDFIVASKEPMKVMEWFTKLSEVEAVTAKGETKSSVRLKGGLQADLRVVPVEQFYFALHHFTGSKDHNIQMRARALKMGYSLSEWGLSKSDEAKTDSGIKVKSEEDLFKALKLKYIEPELREGMGELSLAEKGKLPDLIKVEDIRGVFHNHTTASDGKNTLEEMAKGAQDLGFEYLGIADHSKSSVQANGLDEERLMAQLEKIQAFNSSTKCKVHIFSGTECDILKDGSLDFSKDILAKLDYVVVSVHSSFSLSQEEMTARIIKAIEAPCVTMLGHLTGRLLLRREGYAVSIDKVIDAAVANDVIIELNANPSRLDMDWRHWRRAAEKGVLCSINPDAHNVEGLGYFRAGVNIARKGYLTRDSVINTLKLSEVKKFLLKKKG